MIKPHRTLGIVLALGVPIAALAADHGDLPSAVSSREPSADITDLYAWMTADATRLNLVAAVSPGAGAGATFSDAVVYQFSVSSSPGYDQPQASTLITCKFIDGLNVECWAGDDYAVGDPSVTAGIESDGGGLRVFAGLRDDPFFLEYAGFQNAVNAANAEVAAGRVPFPISEGGCPILSEEQQGALLTALTTGDNGAPASNTFAGANVLALVIQVDTTIVNAGGPVLGVSVSTYSTN
jgi:hypothetical protein